MDDQPGQFNRTSITNTYIYSMSFIAASFISKFPSNPK
jgi:hypothetical protein